MNNSKILRHTINVNKLDFEISKELLSNNHWLNTQVK